LQCGIGAAKTDHKLGKLEVLFARARNQLSLSHSQRKFGNSTLATAPIEPKLIIHLLQDKAQTAGFRLFYQATLCFKNDGLKHFEIRSQLRNEQGSLPLERVFESAI
jgi:hypothetical protein